jgi:hypothetical protein
MSDMGPRDTALGASVVLHRTSTAIPFESAVAQQQKAERKVLLNLDKCHDIGLERRF